MDEPREEGGARDRSRAVGRRLRGEAQSLQLGLVVLQGSTDLTVALFLEFRHLVGVFQRQRGRTAESEAPAVVHAISVAGAVLSSSSAFRRQRRSLSGFPD